MAGWCAVAMLVLLSLSGVVEDQPADASLQHAQALWKANVRKRNPLNQVSADHVCALGSVEKSLLEPVAKAAERAVVFAQRSVGYDQKPKVRENQQMSERPYRWEGKLIVLVCKDRQEFADLFAKLKGGRADHAEISAAVHEREWSYVLLGPYGNSPRKPAWEVEAVQQAGMATLTRRHELIPAWFAAGFGRMLANKYDAKAFASERKRAVAWSSKSHVADVLQEESAQMNPEIFLSLQTALVECLAQSPHYQDKWIALLEEMTFRGSLQAALSEFKWSLETLELEWKNWLARNP
jgi:hypothetical protein